MAARVLVAVDEPSLPRWCADAIDHLRAVAEVEVRYVAGARSRHPGERLAGALVRGAGALARRPVEPRRVEGPYDLLLDLRATATPEPGFGAARTWYYHFGATGARLPFVGEIARGATSVEVQLRERRSDGDYVVAWGRYRSHERYARTVDEALGDAATWPARELTRGPAAGDVPLPRPRRATLGVVTALRFAATRAAARTRKVAETLFVDAVWNVGIVDAPPAAFLAERPEVRARWYAAPHGTRVWIADPIAATDGERGAVFVERFDRAVGRGTLAVLPLDDLAAEPRDVIVRREHLSYPAMVRDGEALYLIPECHQSGGVPVYRAAAFPDRWELTEMMRPAPDLLDPTIFEHGGRWWLFGTRQSDGPNTKLLAWYAYTPLGPWTPHARNPLRTDVTAARPAGPVFRHDGALYRPAQDCARSYGAALAIARIDELTPDRYAETIVARVAPLAGTPYRDGIHTLCATPDGRSVVDGKRYVLAPFRPITALVHRVTRRLAARDAARRYSDAAAYSRER